MNKIAYKAGLKTVVKDYRNRYDEDFEGFEEILDIGLRNTDKVFDDFDDAVNNYKDSDLAYSAMVGELVDDLEEYFEKVLKVMKVMKKEDDRTSYYAIQLKNTINRWLKRDIRHFRRYLVEELDNG